MKISLLPLYSQLNPGPENCPLGCQKNTCLIAQKAPDFRQNSTNPCPLSLHQAETCAQVLRGEAEVMFNTSATADGKSLAAYLAGLLDPKFRIMGLYPTIELVTDQDQQIRNYCKQFGLEGKKQVDSLYGAELARRVEAAGKGKKGERFRQLRLAIKRNHVILTNPDIFHLMTHFRYWNPACDPGLLLAPLAEFLHLYLADEFHIFGVHQEAAILNSLLLLRHSRQSKRSLRFLFTSATPKQGFIKKLRDAGFQVKEVTGKYANQPTPGYRQISQSVELEFVKLETDSLTWLRSMANDIRQILKAQSRPGRGLIILNSVALANRAVDELKQLLADDIEIREVSGQIDPYERAVTRETLRTATKPVLVVATSAVDVGVDFDIHLLIFEASDSATFIQRLGRLGRHAGFSTYKAYVLVPGWMGWIWSRLQAKLQEGQQVDRTQFREEIVAEVFDSQNEFQEYRQYWGALQAQGMLFAMSRDNAKVMQPIKERMTEDLRRIYGEQLDKKRGHWLALGNTKTGQAIQEQLLRFRGGSDLQAAVWDGSRFYTYDLLKFLPYAQVEVIKRQEFLEAAQSLAGYPEAEFPELYIQIYLKLQSRSGQRFPIELECDRGTDELTLGTLSLIDELSIKGHPQQAELNQYLHKKELLTFLVRVDRSHPNSHWDVSNTLRLSPTFGLYRLTDADDDVYACAFNQDALLLEALKWKLKRCAKAKPYIY